MKLLCVHQLSKHCQGQAFTRAMHGLEWQAVVQSSRRYSRVRGYLHRKQTTCLRASVCARRRCFGRRMRWRRAWAIWSRHACTNRLSTAWAMPSCRPATPRRLPRCAQGCTLLRALHIAQEGACAVMGVCMRASVPGSLWVPDCSVAVHLVLS